MQLSDKDRAFAEAVVLGGVRSGNWTAAGLALVANELAGVRELLSDENGLGVGMLLADVLDSLGAIVDGAK